MTASRNFYELLGVAQTADEKTLHRAFRNLSKALHPDTTSLPEEQAAKKFREVCEAYELLSDPSLRKTYDANLKEYQLKQTLFESNSKNLEIRPALSSKTEIGVRRPLSGGELFSLLLLLVALLFSLLIGLGFAIADRRQLQVRPSWLVVDNSFNSSSVSMFRNVINPSRSNSIKPAFFNSLRVLVD